MNNFKDPFKVLSSLKEQPQKKFYSLQKFAEQEQISLARMPHSIKVLLESLLRNCDDQRVKLEDVRELANWQPSNTSPKGVPFVVARVILQDFTGVPLLVDLAAMRDAAASKGASPGLVEPDVPVDLIIDHSVQVDSFGSKDAFSKNLELEFKRNLERYEFLKWGQESFDSLKVFPPGIGIVHQINLEHLAQVVIDKKIEGGHLLYPDTLVGTDSHTTMINALGVVGWGVGGIEAEACMLGQPITIQTPDVIGVNLFGSLPEGVTATDLTLKITEILRKENVVGKFVEFFGEGTASLSIVDRAPISNMAPEYGATLAYFPVDDKTLDYLKLSGRDDAHIKIVEEYLKEQQLFGVPKEGEVDYTKVVTLDLSSIKPCLAGPKRPQDLIYLSDIKDKFSNLLTQDTSAGGYGKTKHTCVKGICIHTTGYYSLDNHQSSGGKHNLDSDETNVAWSEEEMVTNRPINTPVPDLQAKSSSKGTEKCDIILKDGSVVIAAITSCTNTSNPSLMIAAALLAKKACQKKLTVNPKIKTSFAPGSRVVSDYLGSAGLQTYLDELGFNLVAYGCTTCIGNSGPLDEQLESAIKEHEIIAASVLSGNRNFEARIHSSVKANFLMSPPLVVAFALAGRIDIDMDMEPIGFDNNGQPVYLRDIWPSTAEIEDVIKRTISPKLFQERYLASSQKIDKWQNIEVEKSARYNWQKDSSYIQHPPYFDKFNLKLPEPENLQNMRPLAILGDFVTTDHISPAGAILKDSPAGKYLSEKGVPQLEFNSYGSRRGNHHVMVRGTFANVRIRNRLLNGVEGGYTKVFPEETQHSIFEASQIYQKRQTPLIIFAGEGYGMGSSRDWAAKGTYLLGVRVVVAKSYERIHKSNLIGMGVLPLQFKENDDVDKLGITGNETFSIEGFDASLANNITAGQNVELVIKKDKTERRVVLQCRLDTDMEVSYYLNGGILPFVMRSKLTKLCK